MKKLIFALVAGLIVSAAGFTGYKVYNNHQMSKFSPLMLENLQILTQLETWEDCDNKINMAPNGKLTAGETEHNTTVDADSNGNLSIGDKVKGGYEANKTYDVKYVIMNCDPWTGACCDQNEVGIFIVSAKRR